MDKKIFLSLLSAVFVSSAFAQFTIAEPALMKINGRSVPKSEFEYIYNKNNTSAQQPLEEYLDLFIDYKLKVEEALDQRLDTLKSFQDEFNNYKSQITQPYLVDTISEEIVARKLYDRLGENIEVSHILFRFPEGKLLPKDTLAIYEKAMSVREMLSGKDAKTFEELAAEYSEDPSARRGERAGYMGWHTSTTFVAPFEDGMYATPVGEVSLPVRSSFGYHLIKVHNRRPDIGKYKVAHIMFQFAQQMPVEQQEDSIKKLANDIYAKLQAGEDFAELAKEHSTDKPSAVNGGSMGWLQMGSRLPASFLDASFALQNVGEYSEPIRTDFGYHIIKLEDKAERDSWENSKSNLVNQTKRPDMAQLINDEKIKNLAKEFDYEYVLDNNAYQQVLAWANEYHPTDSLFIEKISNNNTPLFRIYSSNYPISGLANYIDKRGKSRISISTDLAEEIVREYVMDELTNKKTALLEDRYPEYRHLLKEYHDGILLFNIMNNEVWDKTANDEEGLEKYFKKNKSKYKWESPKYKGYIIFAKDTETAEQAKQIAQKNKNTTDLNSLLKAGLDSDTTNVVYARKGLWGKGENQYVDYTIFKTGEEAPTPPVNHPEYFVTGKTIKSPEDYTDVKGLVISDLQEVKEKEWIAYLRNKYPVEIDEKVLQTVNK